MSVIRKNAKQSSGNKRTVAQLHKQKKNQIKLKIEKHKEINRHKSSDETKSNVHK